MAYSPQHRAHRTEWIANTRAAEVNRQQRRLARLEAERRKLLEAYYADALPLDLFRAEQERISRELAKPSAL